MDERSSSQEDLEDDGTHLALGATSLAISDEALYLDSSSAWQDVPVTTSPKLQSLETSPKPLETSPKPLETNTIVNETFDNSDQLSARHEKSPTSPRKSSLSPTSEIMDETSGAWQEQNDDIGTTMFSTIQLEEEDGQKEERGETIAETVESARSQGYLGLDEVNAGHTSASENEEEDESAIAPNIATTAPIVGAAVFDQKQLVSQSPFDPEPVKKAETKDALQIKTIEQQPKETSADPHLESSNSLESSLERSVDNSVEEVPKPPETLGHFVSTLNELPKAALDLVSSPKKFLNDQQKIGLAALCWLASRHLAARFAKYEYLVKKEEQLGKQSGSLGKVKSTLRESQSLLSADALEEGFQTEEDSDDDEETNVLRQRVLSLRRERGLIDDTDEPENDEDKQATKISSESLHEQGKTVSHSQLVEENNVSATSSRGNVFEVLETKHEPFADIFNDPRTIDDYIFFGQQVDGNIALAHAMREFQIAADQVVETVFADLEITSEERVFIEQTMLLGLSIHDVAECLVPGPRSEGHDVRPRVLWYLVSVILAQKRGFYDARFRIFLHYVGVEVLKFGSWVDVIERIEVPFTTHESENSTTTAMNQSAAAMVLKNNEREKRAAKDAKKRAFLMTAAAIGGGAILGLSTGLAAPVVGAGLGAILAAVKIGGATAFLTGVGGTALITSGGVIAGTSIGGVKMANRTANVEEFRFIPVQGAADRSANVVISVAGWVTTKEAEWKKKYLSKVKSKRDRSATPSVFEEERGRPRSLTQGSMESVSSTKSQDTPSVNDQAKANTFQASSHAFPASSEEQQETDPEAILAAGLEDLVLPFMGTSAMMGSQYALVFESDVLRTLGDALKMLASEVISFSAQQILQQTILSTVLAALTWPMWLVKLGYLVDNPWGNGLDRAQKAGLILADSLCNNIHSGRPVTLVGYSLGARVIWYCLHELGRRGKYGIVEDVYLFGTPVLMPRVTLPPKNNRDTSSKKPMDAFAAAAASSKQSASTTSSSQSSRSFFAAAPPPKPSEMQSLDDWRIACSVVSGRLVNCYSRADWVLGFLFRASVAGIWDVAGLGPVLLDEQAAEEVIVLEPEESTENNEPDQKSSTETSTKSKEPVKENKEFVECALPTWRGVVQNVDITALVPGHLNYRNAMPMLLRRVAGFAAWSEDIELIEEVVVGSWMEEVDGWWRDERERERARKKKGRKRSNSRRPASVFSTYSDHGSGNATPEPQTPVSAKPKENAIHEST